MKVGVVAYNSEPSGLARASCAIALAPLPPSTFSTIIVSCMMRERWGAIDRRKTSLPPPGLEWVIRVTTWFRFALAHEPAASAVTRIARKRTLARGAPAEYMTAVLPSTSYDELRRYAHRAAAIVVECFADFLFRIHDERAVADDWVTNRFAGHQQRPRIFESL